MEPSKPPNCLLVMSSLLVFFVISVSGENSFMCRTRECDLTSPEGASCAHITNNCTELTQCISLDVFERYRPDYNDRVCPASCALPVRLSMFSHRAARRNRTGYRFGVVKGSRLEYNWIYRGGRSVRPNFIRFNFNTRLECGIMFYAESRDLPNYFLAIYINFGRVYVSVAGGGDAFHLHSLDFYNDGRQHSVFLRIRNRRKMIELVVDRYYRTTTNITSRFFGPLVDAPYYIGGLPESKVFPETLRNMFQREDVNFEGCLGRLAFSQSRFRRPSFKYGINKCYSTQEAGNFFGMHMSYVLLNLTGNASTSHSFSLSMEVKPRRPTGILAQGEALWASGGRFKLELFGDKVVWYGTGGTIRLSVRLPTTDAICNGTWYSISVDKRNSIWTLRVNENVSRRTGYLTASTTGNATQSLSLGGRPGHEDFREPSFQGCMRNVKLNGTRVYLAHGHHALNVRLGRCPKD